MHSFLSTRPLNNPQVLYRCVEALIKGRRQGKARGGRMRWKGEDEGRVGRETGKFTWVEVCRLRGLAVRVFLLCLEAAGHTYTHTHTYIHITITYTCSTHRIAVYILLI